MPAMPRAMNNMPSVGASASATYPPSETNCEMSTTGLRPVRSLSAPQTAAATVDATAIVAKSAPTSTPLAPYFCAKYGSNES
jgi:hypothetical protein